MENHINGQEILPSIWRKIPTSVNDTYGDPYLSYQVDDTVKKLERLKTHEAPVATFTKSPYDKDVIKKIKHLADMKGLTVYYSLTGMDEGGIKFSDRLAMIDALAQTLQRPVIVFTRPIIAGKNDDDETLWQLANIATKYGYLVLGGLHDKNRIKRIKKSVEERLVDYCDELGVKSFYKTCCAASHMHGLPCWMHDLGAPTNVDVVKSLGYDVVSVSNDELLLNKASTGDLNFLRILCNTNVHAQNIISNYNVLSVSKPNQILEAHSSWVPWSRNLSKCVGCGYCIILQIEYLMNKEVDTGICPYDWAKMINDGSASANFDFSVFKKSKLGETGASAKSYEEVRVPQPCFRYRYDDETKIKRAAGFSSQVPV